MSFISTSISFLIVISIILPLFAYVIGMLIPASHIVSRTVNLKLSSIRLWDILIDVSKYPEWQPKVEKVTVQERQENQTLFVEHSTRKRHTVIIQHERVPYKCLLRILEDRPSINKQKKVPTFSGSWTFEITQDKETSDQVTLKITEQGVIKKPIVRVTHMLLFGFHRRIDRFIHDLQALIGEKYGHHVEGKGLQQEEPDASKAISPNDSVLQGGKMMIGDQESYDSAVIPDANNEQSIVERIPIEAEGLSDNNSEHTTADSSPDQQEETSDALMTESKLVGGWDIVSELYKNLPKA